MFYNWLKIEHTWATDLIKDHALPDSYVGLSTKDRRFIYPQKEVTPNYWQAALCLIMTVINSELPLNVHAFLLWYSLAGPSLCSKA